LSCIGSWWVASAWLELPGATQCRKTVRATSLVHRLDDGCFMRGEATRKIWTSAEVLVLLQKLWVWGIFACSLGGIFETFPERELCGGSGEPLCTRGEESNDECSEALTRCESLGLGVFTLPGSFSSMQRHCGGGSYTTVAFSVWWHLPHLLLFQRWSSSKA
jgi:hypothetical protein